MYKVQQLSSYNRKIRLNMCRADKSACEVIQTVIHGECSTPPTHRHLVRISNLFSTGSCPQFRSRLESVIEQRSSTNRASQWLGHVLGTSGRSIKVDCDVISRRTWARLHVDLRITTQQLWSVELLVIMHVYIGLYVTVKRLSITAYWCNAVHYSAVSLRSGGSCYFHLQGRKIEAVSVFCREVFFHPETGCPIFLLHVGNFLPDCTGQITENCDSHSHDQEKLKLHT
jgi:hypothetical protein